jgi:tRNA G18 (ribose-2'-O)-methylase SpoU
MGHVLRVPFAELAGPWPESLERLRAAGLEVAALTPSPDAVPIGAAGLAGQRVALLLGAEGPGLSAEALAAADQRVRIPMASGVDSLNVATAAAVAFHAVGAVVS